MYSVAYSEDGAGYMVGKAIRDSFVESRNVQERKAGWSVVARRQDMAPGPRDIRIGYCLQLLHNQSHSSTFP